MKLNICIIFFALLFYNISFGQFPYATPNITKGSVICSITTESTTMQDHKIIEKTVTKTEFSTRLLLSFVSTAGDLPNYRKKIKNWERLPLILVANNFMRTLNENEPIGAKVPKFPVSISYSSDKWTIDPCNKGEDELVHSFHEQGSGQSMDPLKGVSISFEGLKKDIGFYMVKIFVSGSGGHQKDIPVKSKVYQIDTDDPDYKCKWKDYDGFYTLNDGPSVSSIFLSGTDLPGGYIGNNGRYKYVEDHQAAEDLITTYEYDFYKIDTTSIFNYLIKLPPFQRFSVPGKYHIISKDTRTGDINEFTEISNLTLDFGEIKNELTLSTPNEDDYHNWLPFRKDEDGYIPLQVKAELKSEDEEPKDTIYFYLKEVSHYTGYCTNYPVKDKDLKPDDLADIRFAKEQSDPNIEYIDTFHVKTNKKVSSATVDIESYDYGGYAQLEAKAVMKDVKGFSKYDDIACLILPEDKNENQIADKWEKDVGIYDKKLKQKNDSDEYPKEQKDDGDGWTLFEEYRGFYAEKDFCKESKNNERSGKFVRTDPNWKDVFIFDATNGVFEKWYAPSNAAELNWHILVDGQMKHTGAATINSLVKTLIDDEKPVYIVEKLQEEEHRWINYNTPVEFMLDKHYGLFLFYSDRIRGTSLPGQALFAGTSTPVNNCQYIEIQLYDSYRKYLRYASPVLITCSNYPNCPYRKIGSENDAENPCPKCGSKLNYEKFLTEEEMVKLAQITYEGTVIHEIGHAIGIVGHHTNGVAKFTDAMGVDHAITGKDVPSFGKDQKEAAENALAKCGVINCAMRYNLINLDEFRSRQLLALKLTTYCRKNDSYLDDYGNLQKSDNCFGKITVK